jgi:type IV pilus assembly protein PilO
MAPPPQAAAKKIGSGVKFLLGLVGAIVIAAFYFFFLYGDLSNAINAAKTTNAQLKTDEAAAGQAQQAYLADSAKLEEKKARARDLNKILPENAEMASLLATINQQAEISGLKVRTVTPLDEQAQPYYTRVPIRLEVNGRYHQLAKFFAGISRLDRVMNVENITMTNPVMGDNEETTVNASCLTTAFHMNPKPAGPAPAPGAPPPGGKK